MALIAKALRRVEAERAKEARQEARDAERRDRARQLHGVILAAATFTSSGSFASEWTPYWFEVARLLRAQHAESLVDEVRLPVDPEFVVARELLRQVLKGCGQRDFEDDLTRSLKSMGPGGRAFALRRMFELMAEHVLHQLEMEIRRRNGFPFSRGGGKIDASQAGGLTHAGMRNDSPMLKAATLNEPDRAVLLVLEIVRREQPPRALSGGEIRQMSTDSHLYEFRDADHARRTIYSLRNRGVPIPNTQNGTGYSLGRPLSALCPELEASVVALRESPIQPNTK